MLISPWSFSYPLKLVNFYFPWASLHANQTSQWNYSVEPSGSQCFSITEVCFRDWGPGRGLFWGRNEGGLEHSPEWGRLTLPTVSSSQHSSVFLKSKHPDPSTTLKARPEAAPLAGVWLPPCRLSLTWADGFESRGEFGLTLWPKENARAETVLMQKQIWKSS